MTIKDKIEKMEDHINNIIFYGSVKNGEPLYLDLDIDRDLALSYAYSDLKKKYDFLNANLMTLLHGFRIISDNRDNLKKLANKFIFVHYDISREMEGKYALVLFTRYLPDDVEAIAKKLDLTIESFSLDSCFYGFKLFYDVKLKTIGDNHVIFPYSSGKEIGTKIRVIKNTTASDNVLSVVEGCFNYIFHNKETNNYKDYMEFLEYCSKPETTYICNGLTKISLILGQHEDEELAIICSIVHTTIKKYNEGYEIVVPLSGTLPRPISCDYFKFFKNDEEWLLEKMNDNLPENCVKLSEKIEELQKFMNIIGNLYNNHREI